uniref:Uncharacterized protein n=1 Tax=Anguilla anguilla TaxID=7936 RepID=A0A0E9RRA6_ANGAN
MADIHVTLVLKLYLQQTNLTCLLTKQIIRLQWCVGRWQGNRV